MMTMLVVALVLNGAMAIANAAMANWNRRIAKEHAITTAQLLQLGKIAVAQERLRGGDDA